MERIVQVFSGIHMGLGHPGLSRILDKAVGRRRPRVGELFVFINRRKSAAKVYAGNDTIFHLRPISGKLEMQAIVELPKAIGVDGILNYNKALELALRREK